MSPLPIVEELEVLDEVDARGGPRQPGGVVDELDLQRREEALGHRIVPAIAPAAHAADDLMLCQGLLIRAAGILTPTIRMMQQILGWASTRHRHGEGVEGQVL